jgi:hypothetical protein
MDEIPEEELIDEISEVESDKDNIDYLILIEKRKSKNPDRLSLSGKPRKKIRERKILPLKMGRKVGSKETLPHLSIQKGAENQKVSNDRPFLEL